MEIQALRVLITEEELNDWLSKLLRLPDRIRNLQVKLLPEGISVRGTYQSVIGVSFEMLWEAYIHEARIAARLRRFEAGGWRFGLVKRYVLQTIASETHWSRLEGDRLVFDFDLLLNDKGISIRTNLKTIQCGCGYLVIESGALSDRMP